MSRASPWLWERVALIVACPHCGARRGRWCKTAACGWAGQPHGARYRLGKLEEWQNESRIYTEIERVYSGRIDCKPAPGGARQAAASRVSQRARRGRRLPGRCRAARCWVTVGLPPLRDRSGWQDEEKHDTSNADAARGIGRTLEQLELLKGTG